MWREQNNYSRIKIKVIQQTERNSMKPIIGILAEVDSERVNTVQNTYIKAIEKSGGIPILLPYVEDDRTIECFINKCDGFLFTGGVDINPERYGEEKLPTCGDIQENRDDFEFKVFNKAINTEKPILAICRGIQLVNSALGGTLYQDIPSEVDTQISHRQTEAKFSPSHSVKVIKNTPLSILTEEIEISANSFHHQAIKKLGAGLEIMAVADDGIIEAVYSPQKRYLRAY